MYILILVCVCLVSFCISVRREDIEEGGSIIFVIIVWFMVFGFWYGNCYSNVGFVMSWDDKSLVSFFLVLNYM